MDNVADGPKLVDGKLTPAQQTEAGGRAVLSGPLGASIYCMNGELVRVIDRKPVRLNYDNMIGVIERSYSILSTGAGGMVRYSRPNRQGVIAVTQWLIENAPKLRAIVRHPIVWWNDEGRVEIIDTPGYHAPSQRLLAFDFTLPPVGNEEIKTVVDILLDYGFRTAADRAHGLGWVLLPLVRPMIHGPTPLHTAVASREGQGKTHFTSEAGKIADDLVIRTFSPFRAEAEYQLQASVREPRAVTIWDNVTTQLRGFGTLLGMTTARYYSFRPVGSGNEHTVDMWDHIVGVTGIDPDIDAEYGRRMIPIRLGDRHGKPLIVPDTLAYIDENRPLVIASLLALVRMWGDAGCPKPSRTLASFERWSDVVGGIVEMFAGPDAWLAREHRPVSPQDREIAELLLHWKRDQDGNFEPLFPAFIRDFCLDLGLETLAEDRDRRGATRIGMKLSQIVASGRTYGGLKLTTKRARAGTQYVPIRVQQEVLNAKDEE